MSNLEQRSKWNKANRPSKSHRRNYHHIRDCQKRRLSKKVIEQMLLDLASGHFRTKQEICDKNGVSHGSLERYAEIHKVQFVKNENE